MSWWLEKNRGIAFILTILITIEIFYFSSLKGAVAVVPVINLATVYHLVVFFLFSFFLFATIKGKKDLTPFHIIIVLVISVTQGILDEIHQIFVPFRDSSLRDIMINNIGIFTSILIYTYISRKTEKD
jgi:VanZ family protein